MYSSTACSIGVAICGSIRQATVIFLTLLNKSSGIYLPLILEEVESRDSLVVSRGQLETTSAFSCTTGTLQSMNFLK